MNRKELVQDMSKILPEILPFPKKAKIGQKVILGISDLAAITGFALSSAFSSHGELGYSFITSWLSFHLMAGCFLSRASIQYEIFEKR